MKLTKAQAKICKEFLASFETRSKCSDRHKRMMSVFPNEHRVVNNLIRSGLCRWAKSPRYRGSVAIYPAKMRRALEGKWPPPPNAAKHP